MTHISPDDDRASPRYDRISGWGSVRASYGRPRVHRITSAFGLDTETSSFSMFSPTKLNLVHTGALFYGVTHWLMLVKHFVATVSHRNVLLEKPAARALVNELSRLLAGRLAPTHVLEDNVNAFATFTWHGLLIEKAGRRQLNLLLGRARRSHVGRALLRRVVGRIRDPLIARRAMLHIPLEAWGPLMARFSPHSQDRSAEWPTMSQTLANDQLLSPSSSRFSRCDGRSRFPANEAHAFFINGRHLGWPIVQVVLFLHN